MKNEEEIKKANIELSCIVKQIEELTKQAEELADEFGLEFSLDTTYGMGGIYYGKGYNERNQCTWCVEEGWNPSSQNC
jgi:hypothetical protein